MHLLSYRTVTVGAAAALALAVAACGDSGTAPPPTMGKTTIDSATCESLAGMALGDGTQNRGVGSVRSAVWTPGVTESNPAQSTPDHCLIEGLLNERTNGLDGSEGLGATTGTASYGIEFRLRLPATWNTKFVFQGIGGTAGNIGNALGGLQAAGARDNAVMRGFAVASTDTGHRTVPGINGSYRYGFDPQARLEYGYLFLPIVTSAVKEVVQQAYEQEPSRSYFLGTSGGGRQGMKATQMFPELFDGVVSVVPAFRVPETSVANMVMVQEQASISRPGVDGITPDIATAFSQAQLDFAAAEILRQCDALDGLADGMVFSTSRCNFDSEKLLCPAGTPSADCFTRAQVDVFKRIHDGMPEYASWNYDPGLATGWPGHRLGTVNTVAGAPNNASISTLMAGFLAFDSVVPPVSDPLADVYQYMLTGDPVSELAKLSATSSRFPTSTTELVNAESPNLDGFAERKGRLLIIQGLADPYFSPHDIQHYVDEVIGRYGADAANDIVRLFLVPGMNHGTGGPTTDVSDPLKLLDDWVEKGSAPDSYVATVDPSNEALPSGWSTTRSRLICAYPKEAQYVGGDIESATSFECQ